MEAVAQSVLGTWDFLSFSVPVTFSVAPWGCCVMGPKIRLLELVCQKALAWELEGIGTTKPERRRCSEEN
jgi:hypothetical protein